MHYSCRECSRGSFRRHRRHSSCGDVQQKSVSAYCTWSFASLGPVFTYVCVYTNECSFYYRLICFAQACHTCYTCTRMFESTQAQQMAEYCTNVSEFTYHYSNPVYDYVAILWSVAQCDIERMQIRRTCIPGMLQSHPAKHSCSSY